MKALVKTRQGIGYIELIHVPDKPVGGSEIKIRVVSAGICGTDLHVLHDKVAYVPPVILGHEFSGIVEQCGSDVQGFRKGDRVTAEPSTSTCGQCSYCLRGEYNLCLSRKGLGRLVDGAFAEYILVDRNLVHKIPESLAFPAAALCEPLSVGVHALRKCSPVTAKSVVVVCGPGIIGAFLVALASLRGAKVVVLGISGDEERLAAVERLGACRTVNTDKEESSEVIGELTQGCGADFLFECSGAGRVTDGYLRRLRKEGEIVQVGVFQSKVTLDLNPLIFNEIRVVGSFSQNWSDFEEALRVLSDGSINVDQIPIARLPLEQWERGFKYAEGRKYLKVLLETRES
jgi:L-iditol 2-dehydrogenase